MLVFIQLPANVVFMSCCTGNAYTRACRAHAQYIGYMISSMAGHGSTQVRFRASIVSELTRGVGTLVRAHHQVQLQSV